MEEQIYSNTKKKERNYWKVFAIILVILIISVGIGFGMDYLINKTARDNYNKGAEEMARTIINNQMESQEMFILNEAGEILRVPIASICSGGLK